MGHADHAHGRVFRGIKKVTNNKRSTGYSDNVHEFIHRRQADGPSHNTNGDRIKMNVPEGFPKNGQTGSDQTGSKFAQKAQADDIQGDNDVAVETVFAQVFTTLDQTFDGPPQFFSTQKVEPTSTRASQPAVQTSAAADNSRQQNNNGDDNDQTPSRRPVSQATSTSASSAAPTTTSAAPSNTASAKDDDATSTHSAIHVTSSSIVTGDVASTRGAQLADHTSSAIAGTPISATNSPSDTPEQTGMTGGAKAGLAVGILFGLALVFGLIFFCWRRKKSQRELEEHNEKSAFAGAPVPVNRFSADSEKLRRTSTQTSATAPRLSLRPVTQFLPNLTGTGNGQATSQNPFGDAAVVSDKTAAGHDRANSVNSDSNASVDSAGTAAPGSAQVATAAAVPVTPRGPNNVHRVQLEFKPSMEDELELKSGQLVRMLHEYDDGWVSLHLSHTKARSFTDLISRHFAPRWTAARRVSFLAHVFPRCRSSLVDRPPKMVTHPPDPMACPPHLLVRTSLAHSLPLSKVASVLPLLMACLLANLCRVKLFR